MRVPTTNFQNAFGKYLKLAIEGEDIIITKNGNGVAKMTSYQDPSLYIMKEGTAEYYVRKRVSYSEFCEIVENSESQYELIDGELYMMSSPRHEHQAAFRDIFIDMCQFFKGKPCEVLSAPFDVMLYNDAESFEDDPNVVQPDILVLCDPETINDKGIYHGIPTLVVEILSPSTRTKDMIKKLSLYMLSGVCEYWIVDTEQEKVHIYSFQERKIKDLKTIPFTQCIESDYFEGLRVNLPKRTTK